MNWVPLAVLAAAVVGCGAPAATPISSPAPAAPAPPDTFARDEARHLAGVEYLAAHADLGAAAFHASNATLAFCEAARPTHACADATTARAQAIRSATAAAAIAAPPVTATRLALSSGPGCEEVAARWGAPTTGATAMITLDECRLTSSASAWTPARCLRDGQCPDGSLPERVAPSCPPGQPCQPPPPTCPCFSATRPVAIELHGSWAMGDRRGPIALSNGGRDEVTVFGTAPPPPPAALSRAELADTYVDRATLVVAARLLDVVLARDLDDLALRCAAIVGTTGDLLGIRAEADARCADAWLREPAPTIAAPPVRAIAPVVDVAQYPYRAPLVDDAGRAAIVAELARRAPGWRVTVGILGFIVRADATGSVDDPAAAVARFTRVAWPYLGYAAAPGVTPEAPLRVGIGDAPHALVATGDPLMLADHAWPFMCPAADPAALLAPWQGIRIDVEVPGQPCDPSTNVRCKSIPPSTRREKLTPRQVRLIPTVAIVRGDRDAELRCAAQVVLSGRPVKPVPGLIDVVTSESLDGRVAPE